ncbi:MAG: GntR family transcriptional regulator [Rhodobacter sp.]|nr:GntR family transcriptional regulator [Paracoccaceae bacterium]MCC0077301.1 GntR family transcriptional regulator [Rhodobacter sp.]
MESVSRKSGQSSAEAVEAIRQAIRSGELLPGMHLKQAEWALRLGISRVPVREALGILEAEGILVHEPHQGFAVAVLSESEIRQLYLLRRLIDREIAAALVWPDAPALAALRRLEQAAEDAIAQNDAARWLSCNDRFVLGVYALCPQEILVGEAVKLWRRTETVRSGRVRYEWTALNPEAIRQTVSRILTMLESRDRAGLKAAFARLTRLPGRGAR